MNIKYLQLNASLRAEMARQRNKPHFLNLHIDLEKAEDIPSSEGGFTIIAMEGDLFIGFAEVYIKPIGKSAMHLREAYLEQINVLPNYRRRGVGSELVKRCVDQASKLDVHQIRGFSEEEKIEAIGLWAKCGMALCPTTLQSGKSGYYFIHRFQ